MNTLQKIRALGFDESKLKVDEAQFIDAKNELVITFIYPEKFPISKEAKEQIINLINQDINNQYATTIKFNKSCLDEEVVYNRIEQFIAEKYRVLKNEIKQEDIKVEVTDFGAKILINCDEMRKQILLNRHFDADLKDFLKHKFFVDFEIILEAGKASLEYQDLLNAMPRVDTSLTDALQKEAQINKMEIELGECFYGRYMANKPIFIADLVNFKEKEVYFVAGVVSDINYTTYTPRAKNNEPPVEKEKLTFTITDPSGKIDVVIFPNEKTKPTLKQLEEGMSIAVGGQISAFNDNRNIRAISLSKCEILTKELTRVYRKVNEDYLYIKPEMVKEVQQMDLFSMSNNKTNYWDTHDSVVVFDFETTGLDANSCQIIEIGAVKVVKGSIKETFQTLINPGVPIPAEITAITHISEEMVADAPTIEQVLPDFYKFTYGSVLSAYNIDFDYQFLKNAGNRLRLLFDNEQIDTLKLARDKIPSLSNYKLGTVVKALNITLNNAHRALADAYATAKVFVKLI